jgi:hypothetical protein
MERYDYQQAVKDDIKQYIEDHDVKVTTSNRDELESSLYDDMFISDSVTGNASGSYTFNTWQAEENLCHNLDLLREACEAFGDDGTNILESAESCDVTIRCYLLSQCLGEVLDELEEDDEDEDSDEDDDEDSDQ